MGDWGQNETTKGSSHPETVLDYNARIYRIKRMGAAPSFVEKRINTLEDYTQQAMDSTLDFKDKIEAFIQEFTPPSHGEITIASPAWFTPSYGDRPEFNDATFDPVYTEFDSVVEDPDLEDAKDVAGVTFPDFNVPDPGFEQHSMGELIPLNDPPTADDPKYPDEVPYTVGDPPKRIALDLPTIPPPPDIDLAGFDKELEKWTVDDPERFVWGDDEKNYESDIWADLLAKVLHNIRNGGTGLDAQVEGDIYWQHLNRTLDENDKLIQQASNYWSARGFTLPPGMLSAKINEINAQISRNNLSASKDITISQAELAQKNTHFFIDKGVQLEGMLREFFIQQVNATLQAQRAIAENAIAIYDAAIRKYNYFLEEFKTYLAKYDAEIRLELAKIEVFKGEMEGAKIHGEIERAKADMYAAEVKGFEAEIRAYTARVQASATEAEIEKDKMQIFAEEVKAYLAKVEMNNAIVAEFEAKIRGEQAKATAYNAQVQGYVSEVEGKKAELEGQVAEMNAKIAVNRDKMQQYLGEVEGYKALLSGESAAFGAHAEAYRAKASVYSAETSLHSAHLQAQVGELDARVREADANLRYSIAQVEAALRAFESINNLRLQGQTGIMGVGAQLTASAMNAINASASIGYSAQDTSGESISESHSHSY